MTSAARPLVCASCGAALSPATRTRRTSLCRSCAAKARGMNPQIQRQGGLAKAQRDRQNRTLAERARAAGLAS